MKVPRMFSKRYPTYPDSGMDYAVRESARIALLKTSRLICIYCHGQAVERPVPHDGGCPARHEEA